MSTSLGEPRDVVALLRDAARRFDASPPLRLSVRRLACRGFAGGATWMALALSEIRGEPAKSPAPGASRAGLLKYGAATIAAGVVIGLVARLPIVVVIPAAVIVFYMVEAQGAFVIPVIADGGRSPWRQSRTLFAAAGGTAVIVPRIMVIALVMLMGGFARRGFLRSWCIGCLAMVLWYESLRR